MRKSVVFVLVLILALYVPANLSAEEDVKGLPPDQLAKYCDSFDKLREDLWEKTHLVDTGKQQANFLAGDISIVNGRVRFETRPGGFSKAGFGSKFWLKGDFDIQIDCDFSFSKEKADMDQRIMFIVQEKGKHFRDADFSILHFVKRPGESGSMRLGCQAYFRFAWAGEREVEGFHGTLRLVRTGKTTQALYRKSGEEEWNKLGSCYGSSKDMMLGFTLQNFLWDRNSIKAEIPLSATFDNFKINAAQGIEESPI
ncbi:MAG: hypothetical protein AB1512_21490 [Thermodesulfobacteriota bacterium]